MLKQQEERIVGLLNYVAVCWWLVMGRLITCLISWVSWQWWWCPLPSQSSRDKIWAAQPLLTSPTSPDLTRPLSLSLWGWAALTTLTTIFSTLVSWFSLTWLGGNIWWPPEDRARCLSYWRSEVSRGASPSLTSRVVTSLWGETVWPAGDWQCLSGSLILSCDGVLATRLPPRERLTELPDRPTITTTTRDITWGWGSLLTSSYTQLNTNLKQHPVGSCGQWLYDSPAMTSSWVVIVELWTRLTRRVSSWPTISSRKEIFTEWMGTLLSYWGDLINW